jgi:hypothetical protein
MKRPFYLMVILPLLLSLVSCLGSGGYEIEITTEYGDVFQAICNNDFQKKWRLKVDGDDLFAIQEQMDRTEIKGIWNDDSLRCYLIGTTIIYKRTSDTNFHYFDNNLADNEFLFPVIKSHLLINSVFIYRYFDYFFQNDYDNTIFMLRNLSDKNYDALHSYGISDITPVRGSLTDFAIKELKKIEEATQ